MFLPCLARMAPLGYPADLAWDGSSWEARRDIKGWLSGQLPRGRSYKPTVDQLAMTRSIDFTELRSAQVPCFGSLERGLGFLAHNIGQQGRVYPS